jgi:hypothetical protein
VKACPIRPGAVAILDSDMEKREAGGALQSAPLFLRRRMSKAKPQTRTAGSKASSSIRSAPRAMDLAEIRREITDLVASGAVRMVETTMDEVGKGHYLGMKYLFEMIGLYPALPVDDAPTQDSLAAILLGRLGVPGGPLGESRVTKDSATEASVSEDVLE